MIIVCLLEDILHVVRWSRHCYTYPVRKERYFTPESLWQKACELLDGLQPLRYRRIQVLSPERAALLVLDMQKYFLDEASHAFVPSAEAVLPCIASLVSAWKDLQRPVIFTRHANTIQDAGMMAVWWKDLILPERTEGAIDSALHPEAGTVIEKSQYDAFYNTELDKILRQHGVKQVVITGVLTHLCCESTARSAFMHGYEVFFAIDGTATYTEAFHRATLLNLAHGFAIPVCVEEVMRSLESIKA